MIVVQEIARAGKTAGVVEQLQAAVAAVAPSHRHLVLKLAHELAMRHPAQPALRMVAN
jgi:urease accessory protein UreE